MIDVVAALIDDLSEGGDLYSRHFRDFEAYSQAWRRPGTVAVLSEPAALVRNRSADNDRGGGRSPIGSPGDNDIAHCYKVGVGTDKFPRGWMWLRDREGRTLGEESSEIGARSIPPRKIAGAGAVDSASQL